MTRKGKNTARLALLNAAFILLCLVTLVPVLYALSISFSGQGAALSGDLSFLPKDCQRQFEIVRKRRRNFVVFRRGGNKTKRFLAQKESSRFAVSGA